MSKKQPQQRVVEQVKLSKLNMQTIGYNKIIIMIGARGRGKSTILLDYLFYNQDIPFAMCISPTDIYNQTYTPHIPSRFIYAKYTMELLERFCKRQEEMKTRKTKALMGIGDTRYRNADERGVLIMDDCLADNKGWKTDPSLRWIFFNGRHTGITFVLTMQYQLGLGPEYRANMDWVFICREPKREERVKLFKYYAGIFPTFDMFEQVFLKCTTDRRCMVIHGSSGSDQICEQVFWYKADLHTSFRICYDEFWKDNDFYLSKRLNIKDSTLGGVASKPEEDYFKYVKTTGRVKYDLNLETPVKGEESDW
jgi:hypothetical protein